MRLRLSLFNKVFLSLLLATILIVGGMVVLVNWSFRTGFTAYHHQTEQDRMGLFVEKLSEAYAANGKSWDFIRYDRREWEKLLTQMGERLPQRKGKRQLRRDREDGGKKRPRKNKDDDDRPRRPPPRERHNNYNNADSLEGDYNDRPRRPPPRERHNNYNNADSLEGDYNDRPRRPPPRERHNNYNNADSDSLEGDYNDRPRRPPPRERHNDYNNNYNNDGDFSGEHRPPRRDDDPNQGNRGGRPPHENDFYYRDPYGLSVDELSIDKLSIDRLSTQSPTISSTINQPIVLAANEENITTPSTNNPPADSNSPKPANKNNKTRQQIMASPFGSRLVLLDASERVVIGNRRHLQISNDDNNARQAWLKKQAIQYQQETVGWLVLRQGGRVTSALANTFMQQQMRQLYWIAGLAAVISFVIALLVVRQLLRPVRSLTTGTAALTAGKFATRIPISSHDELGDLAQDFNALAATLAKNETLRQQWIADISHELRTPIAVLRSEIEIILDGIREPTPDRIQSLHTDVLSLAKLVEDLYQLSLSDSGEVVLPDEAVDITMTLYDAACAAEARLQEKSISIKQLDALEQQAQAMPLFIKGDEERLYQIFSNLLANSYRYTDDGGYVELIVQSHRARKKVKIIIQDSAPGVPDAALPRLFERLYRVDKSRSRAAGGSGLGLSIVQNVVTWHEGKIWAEHSPLGGLAICMEFPLIDKVD